ncbi:activator-dependent family glycosyltransferase [Nonomuraea sp. SYSU D8015]|uniref:activator-dependent family glycosyltransferase n=1 Tax=Nonomuraea sp. SYSU D8015 TaxID=2593644 RepID=UPI001660E180|nr:activator-dependent family glycosyltransferase [Nonomuraea sp. SYSU D8015]
MRVLLATQAEQTHFLGMVPLGWALRTAGHEVRVATQPELASAAAGSGLTVVPVGRDHLGRQLLGLAESLGQEGDPGFDLSEDRPERLTWEYVRDGFREIVPWWLRVINEPLVEDLTSFCRQWRPDLVIWELTTFAGAIAAAATGTAHVRFVWGPDLFSRMRGHYLRLMNAQPPAEREDVLAAWLRGHLTRLGEEFSEDLIRGQATIDHTPASLRLDVEPRPMPVRYVPYNGRAVVPDWLRSPARGPRVCVSFGLSSVDRAGYLLPAQEIFDAVAGLEAEFVAPLSGRERERLGRVPDNVRVVDRVPLHALLPTCAAMVNHGGPGTVFTGLAYGVPQVVLPNLFDEPALAANLAARGAGLTIPGSEATGETVRDAVVRLLTEQQFGVQAGRLREEMRRMPTPNALVPQLEAIAARHRRTDLGRGVA